MISNLPRYGSWVVDTKLFLIVFLITIFFSTFFSIFLTCFRSLLGFSGVPTNSQSLNILSTSWDTVFRRNQQNSELCTPFSRRRCGKKWFEGIYLAELVWERKYQILVVCKHFLVVGSNTFRLNKFLNLKKFQSSYDLISCSVVCFWNFLLKWIFFFLVEIFFWVFLVCCIFGFLLVVRIPDFIQLFGFLWSFFRNMIEVQINSIICFKWCLFHSNKNPVVDCKLC